MTLAARLSSFCLSCERILQLLVLFPPGLFSAGGMALWHGVEYYENEKMVGERDFFRPKVTSVSLLLYLHRVSVTS
jgi:hypothetical protein